MTEPGRVVLAATPIGQVGDASPRLRAALAEAGVIAAEDTRRVQRLCRELAVEPRGRLVSYFEGNEQGRLPGLLAALDAGQDVLVVTDAGLPGVSDPGYRLVRAAIEAGREVTALPGPSAVTTALVVSGLPVDRFCFEGFPPRKAGERRRAFTVLADEPRTIVLFESPRRLAATLGELAELFGADRPAVVCRELTKTYEQVVRGSLAELAGWAAGTEVRGEITVVVAGAPPRPQQHSAAELIALVSELERTGSTRRDAIAAVAHQLGRSRREIYNAVVAGSGFSAFPGAGAQAAPSD